jgi:hypothetical protein
MSGILCYTLLLPWYTYSQEWPWQTYVILWAGLAFLLAVRPNLLLEFANAVLRFVGRDPLRTAIVRSNLALWSLVLLGTWFLDGLGLYFAIAAVVPAPPPLPDAIGVSTICALVGLATHILIGGLGAKELTMSILLSVWMPLPTGVAVAIFYRLAQTFIEAFWAMIGRRVGQRQQVSVGHQESESRPGATRLR